MAVDWNAPDTDEKLAALPLNSTPAFEDWTEEDWELADGQITWLCSLDSWDYTQATQSPLDQAVLHWQTYLRSGRHDAVFASIVALAVNAESLSIDSVAEFSDKHPAVLPFRA